jgi:hypothetical protein
MTHVCPSRVDNVDQAVAKNQQTQDDFAKACRTPKNQRPVRQQDLIDSRSDLAPAHGTRAPGRGCGPRFCGGGCLQTLSSDKGRSFWQPETRPLPGKGWNEGWNEMAVSNLESRMSRM